MSYASDALLKETVSRVGQIEKLMAEFRAKVDLLSDRVDNQRPILSAKSNRHTGNPEKVI